MGLVIKIKANVAMIASQNEQIKPPFGGLVQCPKGSIQSMTIGSQKCFEAGSLGSTLLFKPSAEDKQR